MLAFHMVLRDILRHKLRRALRSKVTLVALFVVAAWFFSATLFYYTEHVLNNRSEIDFVASLYWALITMATVGYGDIVPERGPGWAVAALTAVIGIAVYTLAISVIADEFMEASLKRSLGMAPLKNKRIIVIGDTDACRDLIDELVKNRLGSHVGWLVSNKPESEPPVDYLIGSPMKRSDLLKAGIDRAEAVALCLGDDSKTLHVALAVRRLNKRARVVAVVESGEAEDLLREAGVDHVVSSRLLGRTLASAVFEPWVAWFIEEAVSVEGVADVAQETVPPRHVGRSVEEYEEDIARRNGCRALILAVVRSGKPLLAPKRSMRLEPGDVVVYLCARKDATAA